MFQKILRYILSLILLLSMAGTASVQAEELPAESPAEQPTRFVAPKLSKDAEEYDPAKPENLKPEQLYAKSAIVIEADTGMVVFEKNPDEKMYPASTTKILTVLIGLQNGNLEETVYLSETAANVAEDSSKIPLQIGESIQMKDLLYATMLRSGNEGANLIAEAVSGDIATFVNGMNITAQNLGLSNTHFANPHGLHDPDHYTTARDMAKIAQIAMKNPDFAKIVGSSSYTLPKSNMSKRRTLNSRIAEFIVQSEKNPYYYPFGNGIKTGFTNAAGHCFVASAEALGVKLISVVFYSSEAGRWTDTSKLMEYGFSQIVSETIVSMYDLNPIVLETSGYSTSDENLGRLRLDMVPYSGNTEMRIVSTKEKMEAMSRDMLKNSLINYTRDFRAPISKGEPFATLTYINPQTNQTAVYTLVASRDINARENAPLSLWQIEDMVMKDPNFFPDITIELVFYWLIPPTVAYLAVTGIVRLFKRRRHKGRTGLLNRKNKRY